MAHQLPLYFLQRGRPAEALAAAQQLRLTDRLSSAGAGSDAAALLRELLTAAARALPSGLRGATLHTPDGAAVGLCQGLDVPPCMEAPTAHLRLSGAPGVAGALPPFFDCWWGVRRAAEAAGGEEVATLAQGAAAAPVAARPLDVVMADGDGAAAAPLPGSRFPQAPPAGATAALFVGIACFVTHISEELLQPSSVEWYTCCVVHSLPGTMSSVNQRPNYLQLHRPWLQAFWRCPLRRRRSATAPRRYCGRA